MHGSLNLRQLLRAELAQRAESGFDVETIADRVEARGGVDALSYSDLEAFLDELVDVGRLPGWQYVEPDDLAAIRAECDWPAGAAPVPLGAAYAAAVERAWRGRVCGNMLGKPVEGRTREAIDELLLAQDAAPLSDYFLPPCEGNTFEYVDCWPETTRGHIDGSARDDDVDYTILNLDLLRRFGASFTTDQVAAVWLERLPFLQMFTAERVAVRNLVRGDSPDHAALWRNPYREFIGAAIRADVFGYVLPGDPAGAAELAFRDAVLSHRGNGIYSEMWCAALIAASFIATNARDALDRSLGVVPQRSRLHQALTRVRDMHGAGRSWHDVQTAINGEWGSYSWVHAVNNAAVVAAGVLYGDADFSRTITLTVSAGLDTDSNGATAGSVGGVLANYLDPRWTDPIHDTVRSAVFGYDNSHIPALAEQTVEVAAAIRRSAADAVSPRAPLPYEVW